METPILSKHKSLPPKTDDVVDFLYQTADNIRIIHLANLMWKDDEDMSFVRDDKLIGLWKKNLASIRRSTNDDRSALNDHIMNLDIYSSGFLKKFDQSISPIGASLLKKIDRLQKDIHTAWKSELPSKAFFPALELLFREGETRRFHDRLKSLRIRIKKPFQTMHDKLQKVLKALPSDVPGHDISEEYKAQYQIETNRAMQAVENDLNFILSFYERKWSLFLSPERGTDV